MDAPETTPPPAWPASHLARGAFVLALAAACTGVVVVATGGFRLVLPGLRVSARSPWPPLLAALSAAGIGVLLDPRGGGVHLRWLGEWLRRRAAMLALGVSLITLVTGVIHGSVVPSGADASGYLSQAARWRAGDLRLHEPAILQAPWPDAAWTYAPLGYRPGRTPGDLVPTYPPGLPLHFAVAGAAAGEAGMRLVVPLLGALGLWCVFVLGHRLVGPFCGLAAAALLASSPPWLQHLVQPMSDVPAAAWWLVSFALALARTSRRASLALAVGLGAGIAWLVRPNLVLLLPLPLWLLLRARGPWPSTRLRTLAMYAAGVFPAVALMACINTRLYGAPWVSGYGGAAELFALAHVAPNLRLYAGWLLAVHAPLLVLGSMGLVVLLLLREPTADLRTAAPVLAATLVLVVASYLVYAPFESWTYLRFLLPAIAVIALAAGGALEAPSQAAWPGAPVAALLVLVALAGTSWREARDLGVFTTASRERRYGLAATWVARHAPPGVQLLAAQHSGSLRASTPHTVLRWDLIDTGRRSSDDRAWLDLAWTAASGQSSWLVVDAEEEPVFRRRFASVSELGRLDWPPSASTDPPAAVRVYRLDDRARYLAGQAVETARIGRD